MKNTPSIRRFLILSVLLTLTTIGNAVGQEESSSAPEIRSFALQEGNLGGVSSSVNMFTGKANIPINLVGLSGRNGLDVSASILYNGTAIQQQTETWNLEAPTGILGLGWSMGFERIVVDHKGTGSKLDDTYYLIGAGGSTELINIGVSGGVYEYATENYQFWKIYYYPSDERWEIIKDDGSKSIFGGGKTTQDDQFTSSGNSVEWGVKWGNWIGSSVQITNQQQHAVTWNLHKLQNRWNDEIFFEYRQIQQFVGSSQGKRYTEAIYLEKIIDTYGREIRFIYGAKCGDFNLDTSCNGITEYEKPNVKILSAAQPDTNAYQDRYEREYLSHLEVRGVDNSLLFSIELEYDILGTGKLAKRLLTSIVHKNADGESLPDMRFTYIGSGTQRGNLQTVQYPQGALVSYNYQSVTADRSYRDFQVSTLPGYGDTEVFVGEDYVVVTQYKSSGTPKLVVRAYTWDGEWIPSGEIYSTNNVEKNSGQLDFAVFTAKDYFVLIQKYAVNSGTKHAAIFRKSKNVRGAWQSNSYTLGANDKFPNVAIGERYFAIAIENELKRFVIPDPGQPIIFNSIPFGNLLHPGYSADYYLTGASNYMLVYRNNTKHNTTNINDAYRLFFLEANGQWNSMAIYTRGVRTTSKLNWFPSLTMVLMRDENWNSSVLRLQEFGGIITFTALNNATYNQDMTPFFSIVNNSTIGVATRQNVANGVVIGRFDGVSLNTIEFGTPSAGVFSLGNDFAIRGGNSGPNRRAYRRSFNPNTGSWESLHTSTENFGSLTPLIRASQNLFTYNHFVYQRGRNNSWNYLGTLPSFNNYEVNRNFVRPYISNFIAYQIIEGTTGPIKSYATTIKNGTFTGYKSVSGFYPNNTMSEYFGYNTLAYRNGDNIILRRQINDAFNGKQTDLAVNRISINDIFETSRIHFEYDTETATFAPDGSSIQFHEVTQWQDSSTDLISGSDYKYGRTRFYFYNGLSSGESNVPHGLDFRLKGTNYAQRILNRQGEEVSFSKSHYNVFSKTLNNVLKNGWYARLDRTDETTDGITTTTQYTYNQSNGQTATTTTDTPNPAGGTRRFRTEYTYFNEKYPAAADSLNLLSPVVQTINRAGSISSPTIVSVEVNSWKNWDGSVGWAPFRSAVWDGTGSHTNMTWGTGSVPSNWILTSEITKRHSAHGWITESKDVDGIFSSFKWSTSPQQVVASFSNTQEVQVLADNFDRLQLSGGPVNWVTSGPHWKLTQGTLHWNSTSLTMGILYGTSPIDQTNFIADYEISINTGLTPHGAGFQFRKTSADDSYSTSGYSVIFQENGEVQLRAKNTILAQKTIPSGLRKTWYRVRVHAIGSNIKVFVDGELYFDVVNSTYNGEYLGFGAQRADVQFDNLRVYPASAFASSSGYDPVYGQAVSQTDDSGVTARTLYDRFQRPVAGIGADGIPASTSASYLSRELNANFNPLDPNVVHSTSIRGTSGFYEDFSTASKHWTAAGSGSAWTVQDGRLSHTNSGGSSLSTYRLDLGDSLTGRVVIEMDVKMSDIIKIPDPGSDRNFGIAMGSWEWNYSESGAGTAVWAAFSKHATSDFWRLTTRLPSGSGSGTVKDGLKPSHTHRIKIVADIDRQKSSYYINGVPVLHNQTFRTPTYNISKIALLNHGNGNATHWYIDNVVVYTDPIHTVSYMDGSGRPLQSQAEADEGVIISAAHYDGMGRGAVSTRSVLLSSGNPGSPLWFEYRPSFSTYNWYTNQMGGDIISIDNPVYGNYPFVRTRFENSPLSRPIESSKPGSDFAIGENNGTIEYFANRDNDGFMDHLAPDKYPQTYTENADGTVSTTIIDLMGNVLGKAMVLTKPTAELESQVIYETIYPEEFLISIYETNIDESAQYAVFCSLYCNEGFGILVGTSSGGNDVVNHISTSGSSVTGTFSVQQGVTYYIELFKKPMVILGDRSVTFPHSIMVPTWSPGTYDFITTYEYDNQGRLTSIYPPKYASSGSGANYKSEFAYDFFGRQVWQKDPDAGQSRAMYDRTGRLRFSQNAEGSTLNQILYSKYDALGRLKETGYVIQPWDEPTLRGHAEDPNWPATPSTWRKKYFYGETHPSNRGRLTRIETNNNNITSADVIDEFSYDSRGRTIAKTTHVIGSSVPAYVSYRYDNLGNTTDIIYPENTPLVITEIHVNSLKDEINNAGEYIEVTNISGHPVDLQGWTLRDVGGDASQYYTVPSSHILAPGQSALFANDHQTLFTSDYQIPYDFDLSEVWHILRLQNWSSDDVIALQDPSGRTVDLVSWNNVSYQGTAWPMFTSDDESLSFHRKTAITSSDLHVDVSHWEPALRNANNTDRLTHIDRRGDVRYTYNWLGQVTGVGTHEDAYFYGKYSYHANGSIATEELHEMDIERTYSYNAQGLITGIGGDYFTQSLTYTSGGYDGDSYYTGLIASTSYGYSWSNPGTGYPTAPSGYTWRYRYDSRGQLLTAENTLGSAYSVGVGSTKVMQYDAHGNITRFNQGNTTRSNTYFAGTNRLYYNNWLMYNYDASGRISNREASMGIESFTYDPYVDKPVTIMSQVPVRYGYGGGSQRVLKEVNYTSPNPQKTVYIHGLGDYPLAEYRNHGPDPVTRYVYGPSGLLAIHKGLQGTILFPLKDHLGSARVVLETKPSGSGRQVKPLAVYDYWPFGADMQTAGGVAGYRYTGQEYEAETDMYNYRARLYSQHMGHFMAPDPAGQFHSPYVAMGNNPVNMVDPDGEFALALFPILARATVYASNIMNSAVQGESLGTAFKRANRHIGNVESNLQFPVYQSKNTTVTVGLSMFNLGASASVHHTRGDFTFSRGIGVGMGGPYVSTGLTYSSDDWVIGAGYGSGPNHFGYGINATYDGYGGGYHRTHYGGASGLPGNPGSQVVGGVTLQAPGGSFRIENDFLGDRSDRWRTNAVEITIGDFVIGTNLLTNEPDGTVDYHGKSRAGIPNKPFRGEEYGAWKNGQVFHSPLWIGFKSRGYVHRYGYSHEAVQDWTQNWVHRNGFFYLPFGHTHYFNQYDNFQRGFYGNTGIYNDYSLWGR